MDRGMDAWKDKWIDKYTNGLINIITLTSDVILTDL